MATPGDTPTFTTPLAAAAVQLHELFKQLLAAGWERQDALDYLAALVVAGDRQKGTPQ